MKHVIQLKNRSGNKFAAAIVEAALRPGNDLELYEAVRNAGGTYVTAYAEFTFQPIVPAKWTKPEEFERQWIGD
jgi:hypothetical protein